MLIIVVTSNWGANIQTIFIIPKEKYFFSNNQWEKHKAYAYNVDYWSGAGNIGLVTDMVQLRYANYPKDYFMGMLPSSPASGGVAATAAPVPSMQAYKPNFSSVFQSLASLAQAKASEASAGESDRPKSSTDRNCYL
jgi:hypothetical protein